MDYEFRTDRVDYTFPDGLNQGHMEELIDRLHHDGWMPRFACISMDSNSAYYISERPILTQTPVGVLNDK